MTATPQQLGALGDGASLAGADSEGSATCLASERDYLCRAFLDTEELEDLAARARAVVSALESFTSTDDHGHGPTRSLLIRLTQAMADRTRQVLA